MKTRALATLGLAAVVAVLSSPTIACSGDSGSSGYLGVRLQRVEGGLAEALDLEEDTGVLLAQVLGDTPAAEGGLEAGDIVVEIDGEMVGTPGDLRERIRAREAGDKVRIEYLRDGSRKSVEIVLGEVPQLGKKLGHHPRRLVRELRLDRSRGFLGVKTQSLRGDLGEFFGVEEGEGALVVEVVEDSPAEKLGLKAGDVVVEVDGKSIGDPGDLRRVVWEFEEESEVEVVWIRDRKENRGKTTLEVREGAGQRVLSWFGEGEEGLEDIDIRGHLDALKHHVGEGMHKVKRIEIHESTDEALEELRSEIENLREEIDELKKRKGSD
jgi:S1-C subfamily serine protease